MSRAQEIRKRWLEKNKQVLPNEVERVFEWILNQFERCIEERNFYPLTLKYRKNNYKIGHDGDFINFESILPMTDDMEFLEMLKERIDKEEGFSWSTKAGKGADHDCIFLTIEIE